MEEKIGAPLSSKGAAVVREDENQNDLVLLRIAQALDDGPCLFGGYDGLCEEISGILKEAGFSVPLELSSTLDLAGKLWYVSPVWIESGPAVDRRKGMDQPTVNAEEPFTGQKLVRLIYLLQEQDARLIQRVGKLERAARGAYTQEDLRLGEGVPNPEDTRISEE